MDVDLASALRSLRAPAPTAEPAQPTDKAFEADDDLFDDEDEELLSLLGSFDGGVPAAGSPTTPTAAPPASAAPPVTSAAPRANPYARAPIRPAPAAAAAVHATPSTPSAPASAPASASTGRGTVVTTRVPAGASQPRQSLTPPSNTPGGGQGFLSPQFSPAPRDLAADEALMMTQSQATTTTPRRFPGPAGILPPNANISRSFLRSCQSRKRKRTSDMLTKTSKQPAVHRALFLRGAWATMLSTLDLPAYSRPFRPNVSVHPLLKCSLQSIRAGIHKGKIDHLIVLIKSCDVSDADASGVFTDPTGEMQGTIHRRVVDEYEEQLTAGTVLVLRKVSVYSPSPRRHYLNITADNIASLFPVEQPGADPAAETPAAAEIQAAGPEPSQGQRSQGEALVSQETQFTPPGSGEAPPPAPPTAPVTPATSAQPQGATAGIEDGADAALDDLLAGLEDDDFFDDEG